MHCHGLKALVKTIKGTYFAYENGFSYREMRATTGFLASPQ